MTTDAIITNNNTAAALKVKYVEIDAATGEAGVYFDGIDTPLIAANINALAVSVLAESYRQQRPVELNDIGERVSVSESEHVMETVKQYYDPGDGFDFVGYFTSTEFWGGDPELCDILEEIARFETPIWSQWRTGRLGYISIDREKATLLSVPPRKIARDELRATTIAARVAPRAFLYSILRDLVSFGAESTWLENQARIEWGNLEGSPIKPGKLLRKILPGMDENWYIKKSEELAARIKQRFSFVDQIQVSDDLEEIYNMGGTFVSCMKDKGQYYRGIMGAIPNVRIAYITDPENGRLLGRAILWPDVKLSNGESIKLMDRIYSSSELIRQTFRRYAKICGFYYKLEDGHSCKYCSDGEEQISLSGAYVNSAYMFSPGDWPAGAPYMDTFSQLDLGDDKIFSFTTSTQISLRDTNGDGGWLTDPPTCSVCGAQISNLDAETWGDSIYCSRCAQHLEECIHCNRYSHPDQGGIWTEQGFLCELCENMAQQCEKCHCWHYDVEMAEIDIPEISGEICPSCLEKIEEEHDLEECSVSHCRTLLLPDSPGNMCKYHRESLGKICRECGEWIATEHATQFGTFWLCPDCVRILAQGSPLNVGFYCTDCRTFKKGKPAAVCGHIVLCQDCLELQQAPDDYRPPRPAATPTPLEESPDSTLMAALSEWCRRAKSAETPQNMCRILAQLNGRIQTDCDQDGERHRRVFFALCGTLATFFSQSVYLRQSPHQSTILWTQYTTNNLSIKIDLTHNQGNARTWLVARPM